MTTAVSTLTIDSPAFKHDQPVPRQYTADGRNISPPLAWSDAPAGTKEWVLIVDDPDAPRPVPWVHWLIYDIPARARGLPEEVPPAERVANPAGALQGKNSWARTGYGGPEPPRGHGVHHYHFRLYALDANLNLRPGVDKQTLTGAMQGHILAEGELVGTYERK